MATADLTARRAAWSTAGSRVVPATSRRWVVAGIGLAISLCALALRAFHLSTSYDLFIDEVFYGAVSQHVANTGHVGISAGPFYLHPPLFFYIQGALVKVFRPGGLFIQQILDLRWLSVAFATLSTGLVFYIGWRLAGLVAGSVSAVMFALDPFIVRFSSLNMLEPATFFWVLAGLALLAGPVRDGTTVSVRRALLTGGLFSAAILTKETAVFATILPLAVLGWRRWSIAPRSRTVIIGAVPIAPVALYLIDIAVTGQFGSFLHQVSLGFQRVVGSMQETGFHSAAAPSFIATVISDVATFGTTYAIMGLGVAAAIFLLCRPSGANRLVATWEFCAVGFLAYTVAHGALEEQMFYVLMVPSILAVGVATPQVIGWLSTIARGRVAAAGRAIAAMLAIAYLALAGSVWVSTHVISADDAYDHLVSWTFAHVPGGAHIARTSENDGWVFAGQYVTGWWDTVADLRANHAQYVVVSSKLVDQGYAKGSPAFYTWVRAHGTVVYSYDDVSFGALTLYRLPASY